MTSISPAEPGRSRRTRRAVRVAEALAWLLGLVLSGFYVAASVHAERHSVADADRFHRALESRRDIDRSLWSRGRKSAYDNAHSTQLELPEALLVIDRIELEVPVRRGIDEVTLNRSVGRVPGSAEPGATGNTVLAGHRDSFFRQLGGVEHGDRIELETLEGRHVYTVEKTLIVAPDAVHVMDQTDASILTLITCYPFYFVGPAPQRYVVQARRMPD